MNSVLLVENLLSEIQFPSHTLTAEEEATGHEVWRIASGRRWEGYYWTSTTASSATWFTVGCDRVRAVDMFVLDRGHSLAGHGIELRGSNNSAFTSYDTIFDVTIPTVSMPGSIDDAYGVMNEEGAWLKRFDLRAYKYYRCYIDAITGETPQVVGAWCGKSMSTVLRLPSNYGNDLFASGITSEHGWVGRTSGTRRRSGVLNFKLTSLFDFDNIEYNLLGHYSMGRPMWFIENELQGHRAILVARPEGGRVEFARNTDYFYHQGSVPWIEWEPKRR